MNIVYFDLESQKLFEEVGGRDPSKLLLACGVTWSTERNDFAVYWEQDAQALVSELKAADKVVGFNTINFDLIPIEDIERIPRAILSQRPAVRNAIITP